MISDRVVTRSEQSGNYFGIRLHFPEKCSKIDWEGVVPDQFGFDFQTEVAQVNQKVNNLLQHLEAFEVVDLVQEHFLKYGNLAPPLLLAEAMKAVEAEEPMTAEQLARKFHEFYEELAPSYGYITREASAVPWDRVPEQNRFLMVAVCKKILAIEPVVQTERQKIVAYLRKRASESSAPRMWDLQVLADEIERVKL